MRFRVLGALEVRSGAHRLIRLGAAKQRTLLAVLLLNVNRPVTTDRLLEALWPQRPPRTAVVALRTYVSALRQVLGLAGRGEPPLLSTVPGGYQLSVSPADLDLLVFQELADQGRQALGDGLPALAGDRLRRALALWRGRPFEDVPLDPAMEAELILLEELRCPASSGQVPNYGWGKDRKGRQWRGTTDDIARSSKMKPSAWCWTARGRSRMWPKSSASTTPRSETG